MLGEFFASWANDDGQWVPLADPTCSKIAYADAGDDSMLMFYVLMVLGIQLYPAPMLDLTSYFVAANSQREVGIYEPGITWRRLS